MHSPFAALVLAAGASTRMGQPKAALRVHGLPLLELHVHTFAALGINPIAVVLGHQANELQQQLELSTTLVVLNRNYRAGQFSSVQAGLRALLDASPGRLESTGVFLTPVDCPPVPAALLEQLRRRFQASRNGTAIIPTYQEQPGHPVVLGAPAVRAVLHAPSDSSLDAVLRAIRPGIEMLEVADAGVRWNLNTPEDLAKYLEANPSPMAGNPAQSPKIDT